MFFVVFVRFLCAFCFLLCWWITSFWESTDPVQSKVRADDHWKRAHIMLMCSWCILWTWKKKCEKIFPYRCNIPFIFHCPIVWLCFPYNLIHRVHLTCAQPHCSHIINMSNNICISSFWSSSERCSRFAVSLRMHSFHLITYLAVRLIQIRYALKRNSFLSLTFSAGLWWQWWECDTQ